MFAPAAQTSVPGRSQSPRSTGSFDVVIVTTISCAAASLPLSAGSASKRRQNSSTRSGVRDQTTTRSTAGTAARMHASWDSACQPAPIRPSVRAPGAREVPRGDSARRAGAQLPELVGVDDRDELRPVAPEEAGR